MIFRPFLILTVVEKSCSALALMSLTSGCWLWRPATIWPFFCAAYPWSCPYLCLQWQRLEAVREKGYWSPSPSQPPCTFTFKQCESTICQRLGERFNIFPNLIGATELNHPLALKSSTTFPGIRGFFDYVPFPILPLQISFKCAGLRNRLQLSSAFYLY